MINWENLNYSVSSAQMDFNKIQVQTDKVTPIRPTGSFEDVRLQLINARDRVFEKHALDSANRLGYEFDLAYGLEVYQILNEQVGFTKRTAANDDVWRYLSVVIVPDVVHSRWGMNEDHFYKNSRRIWLKTIWWYIELSWNNSIEETYEILKNNTTDTILQLVERPSIGYHVELYRELMRQYNDYEDNDRNLFRSVLKLNTARLAVTTPELVNGGIPAYVNNLFQTVTEGR